MLYGVGEEGKGKERASDQNGEQDMINDGEAIQRDGK